MAYWSNSRGSFNGKRGTSSSGVTVSAVRPWNSERGSSGRTVCCANFKLVVTEFTWKKGDRCTRTRALSAQQCRCGGSPGRVGFTVGDGGCQWGAIDWRHQSHEPVATVVMPTGRPELIEHR